MTEWFARIFAGRPWTDIFRDIGDLLIVAYVIYRALLVVRGTRAMQMGVGLGVIFLLYLAAKVLNLVTLVSLLQYLLSSIILIVVVVFQNDIRRALIRVGGQAWLGRTRKQEQSRVIDEVVAAVTECARHRIGAIIAFEQDANLLEFTKREGTVIGAAVTRELLVALFYPESVNKLHDGAVIIRDLKIARAGVFFPMPDTKLLDKSLGTRHSAALGITEETDAVVVVVSEERGTISFCFNGNIVPNLDGTALRQTLLGLLGQKNKKAPLRIATPRQQPGSDGRSSTTNAGRPSIDPSTKPRDSALATPLPVPRPLSVVRSSTSTPIRTSDVSRGSEAPPEIHRSSTVPLITSKPMPRASVTPVLAKENRPPDSQRPSAIDVAVDSHRAENAEGDGALSSDRGSTPISSAPVSGAPTSHAPTSHAPTSHAPTSNAPTSHAPTSHAPTSNAPTSHAPVSGSGGAGPTSDADASRFERASIPEGDPSEGDRTSFVPKVPVSQGDPAPGGDEP